MKFFSIISVGLVLGNGDKCQHCSTTGMTTENNCKVVGDKLANRRASSSDINDFN